VSSRASDHATLWERIEAVRLAQPPNPAKRSPRLSYDDFAVLLGGRDRGLVLKWKKIGGPGEHYRQRLADLSGEEPDHFALQTDEERATTLADVVRRVEQLETAVAELKRRCR
jgi:hypothetical protein